MPSASSNRELNKMSPTIKSVPLALKQESATKQEHLNFEYMGISF